MARRARGIQGAEEADARQQVHGFAATCVACPAMSSRASNVRRGISQCLRGMRTSSMRTSSRFRKWTGRTRRASCSPTTSSASPAAGMYRTRGLLSAMECRIGAGLTCAHSSTGDSLRRGAELILYPGEPRELRLLSVHLKSGCPTKPSPPRAMPAGDLARQVPALERWIDDQAAAKRPIRHPRRLQPRPAGGAASGAPGGKSLVGDRRRQRPTGRTFTTRPPGKPSVTACPGRDFGPTSTTSCCPVPWLCGTAGILLAGDLPPRRCPARQALGPLPRVGPPARGWLRDAVAGALRSGQRSAPRLDVIAGQTAGSNRFETLTIKLSWLRCSSDLGIMASDFSSRQK